MKKLIVLISIFLCTSILAQAQADPFEKVMDTKGVTTVYISKAMLNMMSNVDAGQMNMEGVDIGDIVKKLTSITVLTSEEPSAIKVLQELASKIKSNKAYEQLMFAKKDDKKAIIYAKVADNEESEMVVVVNEGAKDESVLIRLTGTMTLADIQKITAETK